MNKTSSDLTKWLRSFQTCQHLLPTLLLQCRPQIHRRRQMFSRRKHIPSSNCPTTKSFALLHQRMPVYLMNTLTGKNLGFGVVVFPFGPFGSYVFCFLFLAPLLLFFSGFYHASLLSSVLCLFIEDNSKFRYFRFLCYWLMDGLKKWFFVLDPVQYKSCYLLFYPFYILKTHLFICLFLTKDSCEREGVVEKL